MLVVVIVRFGGSVFQKWCLQVRAGSLHPRLVPVHMWGSRVYGYFIDLIAADET